MHLYGFPAEGLMNFAHLYIAKAPGRTLGLLRITC